MNDADAHDVATERPLVLKFGGTSVQDAAAMNRVAAIVRSKGGNKSVVVTSACAGITNNLVQCAQFCTETNYDDALEIVHEIGKRHIAILNDLSSPQSEHFCGERLNSLIGELEQIVHGTRLLGETTPRTVDTILSFGERLSSILLTTAFREAGLNAVTADSRKFIITDGTHGAARPLTQEIETHVENGLLDLLEEYDIVIAQGFIGSTLSGITTTIGRGGSDHSAALIGGAIDAPEIQIWTDVDGIMTADPRLVPNARAVPQMGFTEARELAWFGAKVIHPDTILPAVRKKIPVVIKNSTAPDHTGTTIYPDGYDVPAGVHSLTMKRDIILVELTVNDPTEDWSIIDRAIRTFTQQDIPVECAVIAEAQAIVAVSESAWNDKLRAGLESLCSLSLRKQIVLLCMIGSGLRATPALLSQPFAALADIPLRLVAAGSSDHIVLAAIDQESANDALIALHTALFEK